MTNFSDSFETAKPSRPTFLTVLCILTFLGSGYAILSGSGSYFSAGKSAMAMKAASAELKAARDSMTKQLDSASSKKPEADISTLIMQGMGDSLGNMASESVLKNKALVEIGGALLCFVGAVLMWLLRKQGFYLYVTGTLLGIAGPIAILGVGNLLATIGAAFWGFFGLIFIVLYAVNLKHMR